MKAAAAAGGARFGEFLALSAGRLAVGAPGAADSAGSVQLFSDLAGRVDRGAVIGAGSGGRLGKVSRDHDLIFVNRFE